MKRGDVAVSHLNSPAPKSEMDLASIDQIKSFYSERLALLENELMKTSEELGRWKAANSKLVENYNVLTEKAGRIDLVDQQRTPTEMQASMERLKIDYERQLQDLRETHMRELESVRKELRLERSVLEEKLGNEMAKTTELRNALHDTRENTSKQLPPTPQMVHLQVAINSSSVILNF